jgi:hypothetical protein
LGVPLVTFPKAATNFSEECFLRECT